MKSEKDEIQAAYDAGCEDTAERHKAEIAAFEGFEGDLSKVEAGIAWKLVMALAEITEACERDAGGPLTEEDDDDDSVAVGDDGESALTFGHMRRARALLDSLGIARLTEGGD